MSYRDSHTDTGHGKRYDDLYAGGYFGQQWMEIEQPLLRAELGRARAEGARTALDFACGTGRITAVVADVLPECTGVDISAEMLALARERLPGCRLLQADLTRDRQGLGPFDVITAFRFFLNAEDSLRHAALDALAALTKPGGRLLASFQWCATSPAGAAYRLRNKVRGVEDPQTARPAPMVALLAEHSFDAVRVHRYGLWPWLGQSHGRWGNRLLPAGERLLTALPPIRPLAQSFLIVAERRSP